LACLLSLSSNSIIHFFSRTLYPRSHQSWEFTFQPIQRASQPNISTSSSRP